ncbi:hypothetical protein APSETT445_002041 [Aspergillus pseudonomiae]
MSAQSPTAKRLAKADSVGFDPQNTEQPPNLTVMPDEDVLKMKHAHRKFVHAIAKEPPALAYQPGTRGIVSTAGGSYLPVLVISLRMLRQTGSELPMEVFLADWDEGLITWPDFWGPTASPLYYTISGQERPPPNIRQSTESGEVFISKRSHLRTLLLVAYYNYWGPGYYYPLLSQGAAGEGDKETFLAAATVLDEPFYQVSEPIRALGRHTNDGFAGSTMVQYSPMEDYALTKKGEWRIKGARVPPPKPFFVHINFPKFNPATVFAENGPMLYMRCQDNPAF